MSIRDRTLVFTDGLPTCARINEELRSARRWDGFYDWVGTGAKVAANAHYYALVDDRGYEATNDATTPDDLDAFMRECSDLPGFVASGPAGVPRVTSEGYAIANNWDTDGSYGDWYAGHELAHSYGRRHPGRCHNQPRDPAHPATGDYPNGDISPSPAGNNAAYGFDIRSRQVLSGTLWKDVMTYCNRQWISDFTSEALQTFFQFNAETTAAAPAAGDVASLWVSGHMNPEATSAVLDPIFLLPGVDAYAAPPSGEYDILQRDGTGNELSRTAFGPNPVHFGAPAPGKPVGDEVAGLYFHMQVSPAAGAERLEIVRNGAVLASVQPGTAPPTVTVTARTGARL